MIIPNGIRVSNKDEYLGGRTILWSGCPFLTRSPSRSTPKLDVHLDPIPMPNRKDHLAKNDSGGGYWRAEVLFFFFQYERRLTKGHQSTRNPLVGGKGLNISMTGIGDTSR